MINSIEDLKSLTKEDLYNLINSDRNNEVKDWLAKLGSERINELFNPEIIIDRAINYWRMQGYSETWISNKITEIIKNH